MALDNLSTGATGSSTQSRCETIDIHVIGEMVAWSRRSTDLGGVGDAGTTPKYFDLNLDANTRATIDLLADAQQLLVDLLPREQSQKELVDQIQLRLAVRLGELLFAVLFSDGKLFRALDEAMKGIENRQHRLLRIELEFRDSSAYMASWPWEYLRTKDDVETKQIGQFLALSTSLVINRTLADRCVDFSKSKPVLLLIVSKARNLGPVVGSEVVAKLQELHDAGMIDLHVLIEPDGDWLSGDRKAVASWTAFSEIVKRESPDIIHFIGHGRLNFSTALRQNVGELAFVDVNGEPKWIKESEIVGAFAQNKPRLVFLQACESALADPRASISGVAMRLALGNVPAVVAMQAKVQNQVANAFAIAFYDSVGQGLPIDWAVKEGRKVIAGIGTLTDTQKLAFGVPVVYLSSYQALIQQAKEGGSGRAASAEPVDSQIKATIELCPRCGESNKQRQENFCLICMLQLRCMNCKSPLSEPVRQNFCGVCGTPVPKSQPFTASPTQPSFIRQPGGEAQDRGPAPDPPAQDVTDLQRDLARRLPGRLPN